MEDFIINVTEVEEWQMINDLPSLDLLFEKAKRTIVRGAVVVLVRRQPDGRQDKFDTFSTMEDLEAYKEQVYKYLK